MYKYPLSSIHKSCVQTWLSKKDKPLFITGQPGTGKSTLSKQLLIDYHIIHVNSDHLKYSGKLCDYIKSEGGSAIYLGGLLQTLFGIKGSRFDERE